MRKWKTGIIDPNSIDEFSNVFFLPQCLVKCLFHSLNPFSIWSRSDDVMFFSLMAEREGARERREDTQVCRAPGNSGQRRGVGDDGIRIDNRSISK